MHRCHRVLLLLLFLCVGWQTSVSRAAQDNTAELISSAQRASRLGKYGFAIHALKQARLLAPTAQLLFEIAEAYRQRFLVKRAAYDRLQALNHYQAYLDSAPQGADSSAARRAVSNLEAIDPKTDPRAMAKAAAAERIATRLSVTASVLGGQVVIDGGQPQKLPLLSTITPGVHILVVSAAGYQNRTQQLTAKKGSVHIVQVALKPEPARLKVTTSVGAAVHVDGRFVGVAPLEEAIEAEPGTRTIAVLLNGHEPHSEALKLERGVTHELDVSLAVTRQRIGASVLLAGGGAAIASGIVFGVLATVKAADADDTFDPQEEQRVLAASDDLRVVSAMTAGIGLGLSLAGGTLFVLDEPRQSRQERTQPTKASRTTLSIAPHGPGLGATLRLRF